MIRSGKQLWKIGCPPNVGLSILDSKTAADKLNRNLDKKDKVLTIHVRLSPCYLFTITAMFFIVLRSEIYLKKRIQFRFDKLSMQTL